jgi:hypothetical protein
MILFYWTTQNYKHLSQHDKTIAILDRAEKRNNFYMLLIKLFAVCKERGLRLIVENPWTQPHFLRNNFLQNPSYVDEDRSRRGDYFVKPTAYWFVNCEPCDGFTYQKDKQIKIINNCKGGIKAGICSEERSMISSDYARNFICDQILGINQPQKSKQLHLFDNV